MAARAGSASSSVALCELELGDRDGPRFPDGARPVFVTFRSPSFTASMDKIGAMYFTVTVFSTVGFGDITAKTDLARSLVTIQMLFNLVVIGLAAKVIFGAVDLGQKKRSAEHREEPAVQHPSEPATGR